jgi:hypothetical protein
MSIPPYPLVWPDGLPRTERKAASQFRTSLSAAINNVQKSLVAFEQLDRLAHSARMAEVDRRLAAKRAGSLLPGSAQAQAPMPWMMAE